MDSEGSVRSIRHWKPWFARDLARVRPAPTQLKVRVGQGVHLLLYDETEFPLHVVLRPAAAGRDGWYTSTRTVGRFTGGDELPAHFRAWLDALRPSIAGAERQPGWSDFLAWADAKEGVSLAKVRPDDRMTSGGDLLVRIHEPCNAKCDFCSCIGIMPDYAISHAQIAAELERGRAGGATTVTFTGGEPTLRRDLPEVVALARTQGFTHVSLQTNGVRLSDAALVTALRQAGLDSVFLSLHGHFAARHDAILKLEGAFDRATVGIDHLLDAGVLVRLNHVLQVDNVADAAAFARFVRDRFAARPQVTWSFVSPIGWALEHLEVIPRLSDALGPLREALDVCAAAGITCDVPGLCGVPLCQAPEHASVFSEWADPQPPPRLETRRYAAVCDGCAVRDKCSGYWKVYLDRYGEAELTPVRQRPPEAAPTR